jgi:hypothetical protein
LWLGRSLSGFQHQHLDTPRLDQRTELRDRAGENGNVP